MNRVVVDQEQRTNGNGEPARKRMNGALNVGQERGDLVLDDPMQATADHLVRIATKAFMQMRNVDYETAQHWIACAAVPEAKIKKQVSNSRKARG